MISGTTLYDMTTKPLPRKQGKTAIGRCASSLERHANSHTKYLFKDAVQNFSHRPNLKFIRAIFQSYRIPFNIAQQLLMGAIARRF